LALSVDPSENDLMQRHPLNPTGGVLTRPIVSLMVVGGLWSTVINMSLYLWARSSGRDDMETMTMVFVSLVMIQFFKAYSFRSDRHSIFRRPFANKWLNLAVAWELVLLLLIIYVPFLHEPFSTFSLTVTDWAIVLALSVTVVPVLEIAKGLRRRGVFGNAE
jgi:Ca2+-transporting ATPase